LILYYENIYLSKELFALIGIFEVILRNAIDKFYRKIKGNNWITDAVVKNIGCLEILYQKSIKEGKTPDKADCAGTIAEINKVINDFSNPAKKNSYKKNYSHTDVLTTMPLSFWRFLFSKPQNKAFGTSLTNIFIKKYRTDAYALIGHKFATINTTRNRIAHQEPIIFNLKEAKDCFSNIMDVFIWLGVNLKFDAIQENIQQSFVKIETLMNT
jgi:hypothetical protein